MRDELLEVLSRGFKYVGDAISADAGASNDASGGTVRSLTEAVMGTTAGLFAIAQALENVASSICSLNLPSPEDE